MIRRTSSLKRTPLRRVSSKRSKELKLYSKARLVFLARHPFCEVWLRDRGFTQSQAIEENGWMAQWGSMANAPRSTEVHHTNGRTGPNFLDESTWLAVCEDSHRWIHAHAREAREKGYLR